MDAKKLFMNIVGLVLGMTEQVLVRCAFVYIYIEITYFSYLYSFYIHISVIVSAYHIRLQIIY